MQDQKLFRKLNSKRLMKIPDGTFVP